MPRTSARPVPAPRCRLAESPRWTGTSWWWVDAEPGHVWTTDDLRSGWTRALTPGLRTSVVHPARGGTVVLGAGQAVRRAHRGPGGWRETGEWGRLDLAPGTVLNDGTADGHGRFWVGAVGPGRRPAEGLLLRIDRDGTTTVAATGFALSNGMAWDDGAGVLLHVDSLARMVWRHRVDAGTGEVLGSEAGLRLPPDDGLPDGIALDVEGHLWVAVYGRGEVRRHRPDGSLERVVDVPTEQVTSVALGGQDGRDMLITTAQEGFDEKRSAEEPEAGRLYVARAPAPGCVVPAAAPDGPARR